MRMKSLYRLAIITIIATVFLSVVSLTKVNAQSEVTKEQLDHISANCLIIKDSLNQLHASDALLRVNRGQLYEAINLRLMDRFNARVGNNGYDSRGLNLISSNYMTALNLFRSNYQAYERQLSAAIKIDCTKQPAEFHVAIESARTLRVKLNGNIKNLNRYIDDYRSGVNDFLINYQRITGDRGSQ